jgi:hypothetical protein
VSEAVDVLHAIERLVALANTGQRTDAAALDEVHSILSRMGLGTEATGYKDEKLMAVREGFESWFGVTAVSKTQLLRDIELLRKALARGSEGQD